MDFALGSGEAEVCALLERALHGRVEFRAETLHDRDDRDRDTGGNQAVLDGGCARLIFCKAFQEICHRRLRRSTLAVCAWFGEPLLPGTPEHAEP